jgi:hypothetical protein
MVRENCTYCGRKGLLIYPVRYAIACPAGAAGVPGLGGNFQIVDAPQDIGDVKYTLRALRPGYLYTYDEKRRLLKGYVVMSRGHLWNFPIALPAPDVSRTTMSCLDPVEVSLSLCVDVRHSAADPAGKFWIGWSSSSWTPTLIKLVDDASWRKKHMQSIDVEAMVAGSALHSAEFKASHTSVSHFAADLKAMQKAFGFSNTPITHEARQRRWTPGIISAFRLHSPNHQGYIAAVNDPVAIANDLAELTIPADSSGFNENVYRGKIIDDLLNETERSVRAQAKAQFSEDHPVVPFKKTNAYTRNFRSFGERVRDMTAGDSQIEKAHEQQQKRFEEARPQHEQAAADKAWKELTTAEGVPLLDDARRKALPGEYERAVKAFEPTALKLAEVHVGWLSSVQLATWMEGVHDSKDIASGFAFRESLAQCIGKAATTIACQKQLTQWLNSPNTADVRNLYLRALLFNHTEIANAAQASIGGGDIKLENAFSIYQGALTRLRQGDAAKLIDRLVLTTANILIKALTFSGKAVSKNAALVSLSLLGRTIIRPSNLTPTDVRNWALVEAKQNGVQFVTSRGQTKSEALKEAKKIVSLSTPDGGICAYELDIAKLEQDGRITPGVMKAVRIPGFDLTKKWLGSSEFNIGAVGVVLQTVALFFAISEYKGADRFDSKTTGYAAVIASVSLTAAVVETIATTVETAPSHPLSAYLYRHWSLGPNTTKLIIGAAKRVAVVAGLFAAVLDLFSGISAWRNGERTLGVLYGVSSIVGGALTLSAFYVGATFFWPAFACAIVIAIVLSIHKQAMLKKWITHCFYAVGDAGPPASKFYVSLEEELKAYRNALGDA